MKISEKEAQELLNSILDGFHLDISDIMNDGEKVDFLSTEGEHLEIVVRAKTDTTLYCASCGIANCQQHSGTKYTMDELYDIPEVEELERRSGSNEWF